MVSKKDKRSSGWITPNIAVSKKLLIENELDYYVKPFYDDWANYRDGFRNLSDKSLIKKYPNTTKLVNWEEPSEIAKNNKKLKRLIRRRKIRRNKLKWEY